MAAAQRAAAAGVTAGDAPCPRCGAALGRGARYCARCGAATPAQRRAGRTSARVRARAERRDAARVVAGTAGAYGGVFAAMFAYAAIAAADVGTAARMALEALSLAGAGAFGLAALGGSAWRASLGGGTGARGVAAGVGGGVVSFALAWAYVTALAALVPAPDAGATVLDPTALDPTVLDPTVLAERARGAALVVALVVALVEVAVLPAVLEEWLCRGVLWEASRRAAGVSATIVLTSALFALLHGLGGGGGFELPHRFVLGCIAGVLRARTGSLVPCVACHFTNNALAVLVAGS